MLLEGKTAVVHGAGGAIGGAAARAFAREGARVYLAGRSPAPLAALAEDIRGAGGVAGTAVVDALDEAAVDAFVDDVAARAGRIDISFNAIGYGDVQQPLMEISVADFLRPIANAMRSQFHTARAAARHMTARGSGVILFFGGGGPQTLPGLGGFKVALDAIEGLRRQWAIELGPHGVRVVTLKSGGVPESVPDGFPAKEAITDGLVKETQLGRCATLADVGEVAAFVASDRARTLTATDVNISCGAIVD
ncbi:SDR family NAD(P)-dependent oxidoreductase [Streptomyces sp. 6N223]|uniref:SDR family NAD(P)-dependent oxidoreductase n=1 Tax=Streptomyces sp. 6N223 TaxID=3457412 RepID=UPI003FD27539